MRRNWSRKRRRRELRRKIVEIVSPLCDLSELGMAVSGSGFICNKTGLIGTSREDDDILWGKSSHDSWQQMDERALELLLETEWSIYRPRPPLVILAETGI